MIAPKSGASRPDGIVVGAASPKVEMGATQRKGVQVDGMDVTRQAIERAVERSSGDDDRILRAVDPALAAAIDALPVGWEAQVARPAAASEVAATSAMSEVAEPPVEEAVEATAPVEEVVVDDPKQVEAERREALVANVVDHLGYLLNNQQEMRHMPQRGDGFLVDMGDGDGVRILCFWQQIYDNDYKHVAQIEAKRLGHELADWVYTGDRENIGEITRCIKCGELGSMVVGGRRAGTVFRARCLPPSRPGSLANTHPAATAAKREAIERDMIARHAKDAPTIDHNLTDND